MRAACAVLSAAASLAWAAGAIVPFSGAQPGRELPAGWQVQRLARIAPADVRLVDDGGVVLEVRSAAASGAAILRFDGDTPARPVLRWRWKVDRVVEGADMARRDGDDFAARVYVFFDVPAETLDLGTRLRIRLARLLYGTEIPTAALCYVWDNRHPVGHAAWNPYTDRVRMVVVESGNALAGQWRDEARDLESDFRAAFGAQWPGPLPRVAGIAAGNDTDQTRATAVARFGDFRLEAGR